MRPVVRLHGVWVIVMVSLLPEASSAAWMPAQFVLTFAAPAGAASARPVAARRWRARRLSAWLASSEQH
jgi:hypothetical protein